MIPMGDGNVAETATTDTPAVPRRRSPLAAAYSPGDYGALGSDGPKVMLSERPGLTTVQVECAAADIQTVADRLQQALGQRPPETANTSHGDDTLRLIWAGPARWHLTEPDGRDLEAELFDALSGTEAAVVDLSHSRAVIRLAGPEARHVLAKGSGLDFHAQVFTPGACAQTALFHVAVLIDCRDDTPSFDIYAARGLACSLWQSLSHAAAEYGYRVL